ncbi:MAG: hypothetical protein ACOH1O_05595 [Flavobacterium sp.]
MVKKETVAISNKKPIINVESNEIIPLSTSEKFQIKKEILAINDKRRNKPMKALSNENLEGKSFDSILKVILFKTNIQF